MKVEEENERTAKEMDSYGKEGGAAAPDIFDQVMSSASAVNVLGEYDWFEKNLPQLLENAEKDLLHKVHEHMKIQEMKELIGHERSKVGHKGDQYPILDALSIKLGISLR